MGHRQISCVLESTYTTLTDHIQRDAQMSLFDQEWLDRLSGMPPTAANGWPLNYDVFCVPQGQALAPKTQGLQMQPVGGFPSLPEFMNFKTFWEDHLRGTSKAWSLFCGPSTLQVSAGRPPAGPQAKPPNAFAFRRC